MTFEEFFNLIFPVLADEKSIDAFMREIFDHILDLPEDGSVVNPLYNNTGATLRKYVNPNDAMHHLPAKLIRPVHKYTNATLFSTYLRTYPKEALTNLAAVLSPYISDVTPANVHDRCADLFRHILDDLVGFTREPPQLSLASVVNTTLSPTIVENYGTRLLLETHGFCPYKGCTNELHEVTSSGTAEPTYALTLIDTMKRPSYENLIALCPACHARYLAEQESGFYETSLAFLRQKKQELMIEETTNSILSQHEIETGVDRLLRKIQVDLVELSDEELEELKLNYDPVKVRQKIPGNDLEQKMLRTKVLRNVRAYFNLVNQSLRNLNKERVIRQRVFSSQVRSLFIDFDETTIDGMSLTQTLIFDKLVDWLHRRTDEASDVCAIVISYFIQSCEVFDVISE